MKDLIIAVGGADCGLTPYMPFAGKRFDGAECTCLARLMLEIALLRCGFDISDRRAPLSDPQEIVLQSNRVQADCIVVMSCSAFGSRKSFNNVSGGTVKYHIGRQSGRSRELAEDICAKLDGIKKCCTASGDSTYGGAYCPSVVVEMGYLTDFDEAKLMCDPDYLCHIAEYVAMGICEYFGMPYIPPAPVSYSELAGLEIGMRGRKIKLLQAALCAAGYATDIDGVYGKNTDMSVKAFAINNGHENYGDKLIHDLFFVTPTDLTPNSKRTGVLYLQRKLCAKLYKAPKSGVLCEDTVCAINEFLTETENESAYSDCGVTREAMLLLAEIGGGRPRLF